MGQRLFFALALGQGGEFAFVLLGFGVAEGVIESELSQIVIAAVALTMAATPLILMFEEKVLRRKFSDAENEEEEADEIEENAPVILAGFGRFGNYVGRLLHSQGIPVTVIDHDSDHIDFLRRVGIKAYFGDACRLDLLKSAGAGEAKVMVIALENSEKSVELVSEIREHFPNLKIFARATDRPDMYRLINERVDYVVHQHAGSAISLGSEVLKALGVRANKAARVASWFEKNDRESADEMAEVYLDDETYVSRVRERISCLESQFAEEARTPMDTVESAWDNEPIRHGVVAGHENSKHLGGNGD
ncbi:MAG: NAD-binding protein, partial [Verrucomicrobiota bacterium]